MNNNYIPAYLRKFPLWISRHGLYFLSVFCFVAVTHSEPLFAGTFPELGLNIVQQASGPSYLSLAFSKVSKMDGFGTIPESEMRELFSPKLGEVQCVIHANSEPRARVLEELKEIPSELLYSVHMDDTMIVRCYIQEDSDGQAQMLFAVVGTGSEDLLVALAGGAEVSVYQKWGDSLKDYSFEEMEGYIVNYNAECPMVLGPSIEITSMSINRQYWTIRMKLDTMGNGFVKGYEGEGAKNFAKTMIKGFHKQQIGNIFNLGLGFKIVITIENGDTRTIVLEPSDIAEILIEIETTPEQALNLYIENSKKSCPSVMANGMTMVDIRLENGVLFSVVSVDEDMYSLDAMNNNRESIRNNMKSIIKEEKDVLSTQLANWLVNTGNGMGHIYIGNSSKKTVSIIIPCDELRQLLN